MIRVIGIIIALALTMPSAAVAQTTGAETRIVKELQDDGFWEIRITRTWLGRLRIVAIGEQGVREIVLHPSTGAILRDYLDVSQSASGPGNSGQSGNNGNSGNAGGNNNNGKGGGPGGDNDDDDDDDDQDDDRNGGNSGKG